MDERIKEAIDDSHARLNMQRFEWFLEKFNVAFGFYPGDHEVVVQRFDDLPTYTFAGDTWKIDQGNLELLVKHDVRVGLFSKKTRTEYSWHFVFNPFQYEKLKRES